MPNSSIDTLARKGADYAQDAASVLDTVASEAASRLADAADKAQAVIGKTADRAQGALVTLKNQSRSGYGDLSDFVRGRPLLVIGATVALGLAASLLLGRQLAAAQSNKTA